MYVHAYIHITRQNNDVHNLHGTERLGTGKQFQLFYYAILMKHVFNHIKQSA